MTPEVPLASSTHSPGLAEPTVIGSAESPPVPTSGPACLACEPCGRPAPSRQAVLALVAIMCGLSHHACDKFRASPTSDGTPARSPERCSASDHAVPNLRLSPPPNRRTEVAARGLRCYFSEVSKSHDSLLLDFEFEPNDPANPPSLVKTSGWPSVGYRRGEIGVTFGPATLGVSPLGVGNHYPDLSYSLSRVEPGTTKIPIRLSFPLVTTQPNEQYVPDRFSLPRYTESVGSRPTSHWKRSRVVEQARGSHPPSTDVFVVVRVAYLFEHDLSHLEDDLRLPQCRTFDCVLPHITWCWTTLHIDSHLAWRVIP